MDRLNYSYAKQINLISKSLLNLKRYDFKIWNLKILLFSNDFNKYSDSDIQAIFDFFVSRKVTEIVYVWKWSKRLYERSLLLFWSVNFEDEEESYEWAIASFYQDQKKDINKYFVYESEEQIKYFDKWHHKLHTEHL